MKITMPPRLKDAVEAMKRNPEGFHKAFMGVRAKRGAESAPGESGGSDNDEAPVYTTTDHAANAKTADQTV